MKQLNGIDVSDNQGVINWNKVKNAGVQFAILRSVRGSGRTDHQFVNNVNGCRENGIPFDVYKYVYAKSVAAARQEMELVCKLLKENNIHCIVWYDLEDQSLLSLGGQGLTQITKAAEEVVKENGFQFGIYCNKWWYTGVLKNSDFDNPFWIAKYGSNKAATFDNVPEVGNTLDFVKHDLFGWQWGSKGRVNGIGTDVDMDLLFLKDDEQLREPEPPAQAEKEPEKAYVRTEAAKSRDKSLTGTYRVTAKSGLYLRSGAGTDKNAIALMPYGSKVQCYGYYTQAGNVKWYYIIYDGITGFASSQYLGK